MTGLPPGWTATFSGPSCSPCEAPTSAASASRSSRDAGVGAVAGLAVADGAEGRLDDVLRRRQVHVAEVERVDGVAELSPLVRLGGDGERRLGPEAADALGHRARPWCAHAAHPLNVEGQGDVPITLSATDARPCTPGARPVAFRWPESFGGASGAILAPSAPAHSFERRALTRPSTGHPRFPGTVAPGFRQWQRPRPDVSLPRPTSRRPRLRSAESGGGRSRRASVDSGAVSTQEQTSARRPRVFSGIQPSGTLHLGNYLGAIRN